MQVKYNVVPRIQHYGCIVALLGSAGRLEEALRIIHDMPVEPDVLIWKAIASASIKHNDFLMRQKAALRAIKLAPEDSSCYVLLSNVYAKAGMWDEVTKVSSLMRSRDVRKIPGDSYILVNGEVHEFQVGKAMDVENNQNVLSKLEEVVSKLKSEAYEPDINHVFLDIECDEKDSQLTLHSEKMAIAFALSSIPQGIPNHTVKNLRICVTHSFSWFLKATTVELLSETQIVSIILKRVAVPAEIIGNFAML